MKKIKNNSKISKKQPERKITRMQEWKHEFATHKHLILISFVFLVVALLLNFIAGTYVDKTQTVAASDIILDHIPVVDLSLVFIYFYAFIILLLFIYPLWFNMKGFHIVISQFSLLVLIRSFFITLTHLRVPPGAISVTGSYLHSFFIYQMICFSQGIPQYHS